MGNECFDFNAALLFRTTAAFRTALELTAAVACMSVVFDCQKIKAPARASEVCLTECHAHPTWLRKQHSATIVEAFSRNQPDRS